MVSVSFIVPLMMGLMGTRVVHVGVQQLANSDMMTGGLVDACEACIRAALATIAY
jgi:hypothetical protein